VSLTDTLLEHSVVYRFWQAPFAEAKLAPLRAHNDLTAARRVLDVGCGPGTNAPHFRGSDYLGIDLNPRYIADARRRFGRRFEVADVTTFKVEEEPFDFILVNSLLHHLDDDGTRYLLSHLGSLLAPRGHVHILELVLPSGPSPARFLARADRGKHARPLARWRVLLEEHFEPVVVEPYELTFAKVPLWHMVYFKGRAKA
jgi:SAM-dependent methyltransferase